MLISISLKPFFKNTTKVLLSRSGFTLFFKNPNDVTSLVHWDQGTLARTFHHITFTVPTKLKKLTNHDLFYKPDLIDKYLYVLCWAFVTNLVT